MRVFHDLTVGQIYFLERIELVVEYGEYLESVGESNSNKHAERVETYAERFLLKILADNTSFFLILCLIVVPDLDGVVLGTSGEDILGD